VGIAIAMLSAARATQYARAKVGYEYNIVNPTEAYIRFIANDNSSDGLKVLRADDASGSNLRIVLGNWSKGQTKIYTAAFGIVNEEKFAINITGITITGTGTAYMYVYLHNNSDKLAENDDGMLIWNGDTSGTTNYFNWTLAAGNNNPSDASGKTTPVDGTTHVRCLNGTDNAANTDHVWVEVKLVIPDGASVGSYTGSIEFHFKAA